ncbi:polysaccharide biosynthesis/export family protein [Hyphomicrobium sp.]|uniref:polysaccharide biosynthesis/export family protein n=1 Tax=Hyphomicrobium sp. TaxID=82 RepID=UPI0025C30D38|nr:polysaccharide biosynthesis/export family protein [Hyphomicrobium sp.]MCC7250775.1 polysaccharide biosynthesis/export family protein [Hyphomicrobium sp.]
MRIIRVLAFSAPLFLYCLVCSVPVALAGGSEAPEVLDVGDRLTVTVFGQPEMSGDFQVDGTGEIELPIVGAIRVGELTPKDAQKRIEERLADGYILHPTVSIAVTERRPIYVLGDVRTPGTFPFRTGNTVMNAVAQAGGYGVAGQPLVGVAMADYLLSDERVKTLESTHVQLTVRKARLEAQLDGRDTFDAPVFPGLDIELLDTAMANEKDMLHRQRQALHLQIDLVRSQKPRIQGAMEAVETQIESEKKQQDLVRAQLDDWNKMKEKGLALRVTEVSLLREQAAIDVAMSGFRTELARLAVTMGELDIKVHELEAADRQRVANELQEVRTRLHELETTLPSARRVRDVRMQQAENGRSENAMGQSHRIVIRRSLKTGTKTIAATEETQLEPGDIIEVFWISPNSDSSAYRQPSTRKQAQLEEFAPEGE